MNNGMWTLLVVEQQYDKLVTCVTERVFDKPTMDWIVDTVAKWPNRSICDSPRHLQMFLWHLLSSVDIDTHVAMLHMSAELNEKLALLQSQKQKLAVRMIKKIQKGIKQLEKMNVSKNRARQRRMKLKNGRR